MIEDRKTLQLIAIARFRAAVRRYCGERETLSREALRPYLQEVIAHGYACRELGISAERLGQVVSDELQKSS